MMTGQLGWKKIDLRERSLFMAGVGAEEKVLCALKKILPHH